MLVAVGLLVGLGASNPALAVPTNFSFTGIFSADDDVQSFLFTADGASTITLRTYSYAGGTQADGNIVSAGGFDPILAIFDSLGVFLGENDDGVGVPFDPNTGEAFDTLLSQVLPAGSYTVTIMQFDNFAIGPNLANGFERAGEPFFTADLVGCSNEEFCDVSGVDPFNNRTNAWAFDILNVETAVVPEPSTALLLGLGLVGLGAARRRA